jgi:predicted nucleotidyltransferase
MLFCLKGYLHPLDRYAAYLKYSPDPDAKWHADITTYRRELPYYHVSTVAVTIRYLEAQYPHYVSHCPMRDIRFSMVPHDHVARYFRPKNGCARSSPHQRILWKKRPVRWSLIWGPSPGCPLSTWV